MLKFLKFCLAFLLLFQVSVAENDCDHAYRKFSQAIDNNPSLVDALDNDIDLIRYWEALYNYGKRGEALTNPNVLKFFKKTHSSEFLDLRSKLLRDLDELELSKFTDDFLDDIEKVRSLNLKPNLVDSWKLAISQPLIRKDIDWLTKVDNWKKVGASADDVKKLINEIAINSTLKDAFNTNKVIFEAWKWIDKNISTLPRGQPATYVNYLIKKTTYIKQSAKTDGTVTYYRAQIAGIDGPEEIIKVVNGRVTFGNSYHDWLNFSTDNIKHAEYFKNKNPGSYIVSFEMPKSFDIMMKKYAIPQWGAKNNKEFLDGLAPQIADPNQVGHPFTTRKWKEYWKSEFQQNVIQGTGKIIR